MLSFMSLQLRTEWFFQNNHLQTAWFHSSISKFQFPFGWSDVRFHWLSHEDSQSFGLSKWCESHELFARSSFQASVQFGLRVRFQLRRTLRVALYMKQGMIQVFLFLNLAFLFFLGFTQVVNQDHQVVYQLIILQDEFYWSLPFNCCTIL